MKKRLTSDARTRMLTQDEAAFIKSASEALATESGFEKEWIEKKLISTLPSPGIGFSYTQPPMLGLFLFKPSLFDAMKILSEDEVEKYFGDEFQKIIIREANYNAIINEVPFQSIEDVEGQLESFMEYLKKQSTSIIETGLVAEDFKESPWLQKIFTQPKPLRLSRQAKAPLMDFLRKCPAQHPGLKNSGSVLPTESLVELLGDASDAALNDISYWWAQPKELDILRDNLREALRASRDDQDSNSYLHRRRGSTIIIPPGMSKKEETFRHLLLDFSIKCAESMKRAIESEHTNLLDECWENLLSTLNGDQLLLLTNQSYRALGIKTEPDGLTEYTYGPNFVSQIFRTAAIFDATMYDSEFLAGISDDLEEVIKASKIAGSRQIERIRPSFFEAIHLCGEDAVFHACDKYQKISRDIQKIEEKVKTILNKTSEISIARIRETKERIKTLTQYREMTGFDASMIVTKVERKPEPEMEFGAFSQGYLTYKSKNSKFTDLFKFSPRAAKAMAILHKAAQSGRPEVTVQELVDKIYTDEEKAELPRTKDSRYTWRITHDLLNTKDPAVKFGFIKSGKKNGFDRTYYMDVSFDDLSPEEILKNKASAAENKKAKAEREKKEKEARLQSKAKAATKPSKDHSFRNSFSSKASKKSTPKGKTKA